jgi:beta-1,4-mannosyltransferase
LKVVSVRPAWVATSNRFTYLFSQAVQNAGWGVREFSWSKSGVFAPEIILIHWPDELFTAKGVVDGAKALIKIILFQTARQMFGVRLVWLVHETHPHDVGRPSKWSTRAFLNMLDGAIYLSHASKVAAEADLPELKRIPALVTRHGHYRFDMERPPQPRRQLGRPLNLIYFGQVRPYKNLDGLIQAARGFSPDQVRLKIMGWSKDPEFTRMLANLASTAPAVTLDIRDTFVPQQDIETALDESDGAVLPYRNILNSGAALFALSRNRPILAPRLGTLPELQDEIGADWAELYDGDITEDSLRAFIGLLGKSQAPVADLSPYEWEPIGEEIGCFFDQLRSKPTGFHSERLQRGMARS